MFNYLYIFIYNIYQIVSFCLSKNKIDCILIKIFDYTTYRCYPCQHDTKKHVEMHVEQPKRRRHEGRPTRPHDGDESGEESGGESREEYCLYPAVYAGPVYN